MRMESPGYPQARRHLGGDFAVSRAATLQADCMTASTTPQPAVPKPADAWVSIGAAVQSVLAKLKVSS